MFVRLRNKLEKEHCQSKNKKNCIANPKINRNTRTIERWNPHEIEAEDDTLEILNAIYPVYKSKVNNISYVSNGNCNEELLENFDIPEIHSTLNYGPVIRYAHLPTHPNGWEAVSVSLVRVDGPADPSGRCSDANDGPVVVSLPAGANSVELPATFCLEAGQR